MRKLALLLLLFTTPVQAQTYGGPPSIYAPDGKYLGDLDGNPYNRNSVNNPYGPYGNPYGNTVTNPYGKYGSPYSPYSPNFEYGRGNSDRSVK